MSDKSKTNKRPINPEIPAIEVKEKVEAGVEHAAFKILRQAGAANIIATVVSKEVLPLRWLLSGEFEQWLDRLCGGGNYIIEAKDCDSDDLLVPRFRVVLTGPSKDPKRVAAAAANPFGMMQVPGVPMMPGAMPVGMGGMIPPGVPRPTMDALGQISLPPQEELPPIYRHLPVMQQWDAYYQRQGLPPGASVHSDALAMSHTNLMQSQLSAERVESAKLRAQVEAVSKSAQDKIEALTATVAQMQAERIKSESDAKIDLLRAELVAMRQAVSAPRAGTADWIAPLAPVLGSVLTAMIQSSSNNTVAQMKQGQDQLAVVLSAINKPKDQTDWPKILAAVAPLAGPFLAEMAKSMNPEVRASVSGQADEIKIAMLKMMMDFVVAQQGEPPPPWMPMVEGVISSLAEAWGMKGMAPGLPSGGSPRQLPAGQRSEDDSVWASFSQVDENAAQVTREIWNRVPPQLGFHTHEWRVLIFNIHRRLEPRVLAHEIVLHLDQCRKYMLLPQPLQQVFDPEHAQESIANVLGSMPIAQMDSAYAQLLGDCLMSELEEAMRQIAQAETEGANAKPTITPAPRNGSAGAKVAFVEEDGEEEDDEEENEDVLSG